MLNRNHIPTFITATIALVLGVWLNTSSLNTEDLRVSLFTLILAGILYVISCIQFLKGKND
jgi:hypothetical protein